MRRGSSGRLEVAPYRGAPGRDRRRPRRARCADEAEGLYQRLTDAGVEVLYDDRDESPGVKFTDAELLGMPTIVTISPRSLAAGGAEVTDRASGERSVRPIADVEACSERRCVRRRWRPARSRPPRG